MIGVVGFIGVVFIDAVIVELAGLSSSPDPTTGQHNPQKGSAYEEEETDAC